MPYELVAALVAFLLCMWLARIREKEMVRRIRESEALRGSRESDQLYVLYDGKTLVGSTFKSVAIARDHAMALREEFGVCASFSIGYYKNGKYIVVYSNDKTISCFDQHDH